MGRCMGAQSTKDLRKEGARAISGTDETNVTGREMKGRDSG